MNPETPDYSDAGHQDSHGNSLFHGYAGFWKRYAAAFIDGGIFFVVCFIAGFVFSVFQLEVEPVIWLAIVLVVAWLYFALFECSSSQATPGKMAVGIKVTDMGGDRISFGRASGRHVGKILSHSFFLMGYIMVAFTQKKQGWHDFFAECLVVNTCAPTRTKTATTVVFSAIGTMLGAIVLFATTAHVVSSANGSALCWRSKDIYISIIGANTEREPLGLGTVWPKAGKKMEDRNDDISEMTFENSTDYFKVLYDDKNRGTTNWAPYAQGFDYSKCAGAGVPLDAQGGADGREQCMDNRRQHH